VSLVALLIVATLESRSAAAAPVPAAGLPVGRAPAGDAGAGDTEARKVAEDERRLLARLRALREAPGGSGHLVGSLGIGKGLRFNNPFRLATQLGEDAASASLTATYLDLGLAATYGAEGGLQHGAALHLGGALQGISQAFVTPTYLVTHRLDPRWVVLGRAGPSFLFTPDPNVGGELAAGAMLFATAGLGVSAEALFDLFYGAATLDAVATLHPILSLQLGLVVDLEVLP